MRIQHGAETQAGDRVCSASCEEGWKALLPHQLTAASLLLEGHSFSGKSLSFLIKNSTAFHQAGRWVRFTSAGNQFWL